MGLTFHVNVVKLLLTEFPEFLLLRLHRILYLLSIESLCMLIALLQYRCWEDSIGIFVYPLYDEPQCDNLENYDLGVHEWNVCYDEVQKSYVEVVIFFNKRLARLIDVIMEQWIGPYQMYWIRGDDEEVFTNEEFSNLEETDTCKEIEIAEIFRIETNIFHFETPLCKAFEEYKASWMYECNEDVPWEDHEPWKEPTAVKHRCEPFYFKNKHSQLPTCYWNDGKHYNGGDLHGMIREENSIRYQDYEWYDALEDSDLKKEALYNKAV
ncbi:hypothetical protein Tco_1352969 [Tanacetum coccineum]